ncbi:uncharacterized protein F5891DRAFT_1170595 [Suillus fuscotomentosus]|uniref:Uncharacterized protein n=1 Tax=Suillus fuscotomentosus TaxID=1912939 RepID=A0AAD4HPA7_9AGAM|nr:uncharacterized protein F5891DRAFT_1170595 [Suillus fuscotomentosus]KAG1905100.1 hypothetical protein F5891DRAFT_1170595 [Suillus fuscotomentosus]
MAPAIFSVVQMFVMLAPGTMPVREYNAKLVARFRHSYWSPYIYRLTVSFQKLAYLFLANADIPLQVSVICSVSTRHLYTKLSVWLGLPALHLKMQTKGIAPSSKSHHVLDELERELRARRGVTVSAQTLLRTLHIGSHKINFQVQTLTPS